MEAPKLPSIFKQHRAKHFSFKPRHYDERKERLEKLRAKYQKEASQSAEKKVKRAEIEDRFRSEWQSRRQSSVKSSNRVLLLIITGLLFLTYYIIMY